MAAGKGRPGPSQQKESQLNGRSGRCVGDHGTGDARCESWACKSWHWTCVQCQREVSSAEACSSSEQIQACSVEPICAWEQDDAGLFPCERRRQAPKTRRASEIKALTTRRKRLRLGARAAGRSSEKEGHMESTHSGWSRRHAARFREKFGGSSVGSPLVATGPFI